MSTAVYGVYRYLAPNTSGVGKVGLARFNGNAIARVGNLVTGELHGDPKVFSYISIDTAGKRSVRLLVCDTIWVNWVAQPSHLTSYDESLNQIGTLNNTVVSGGTTAGKKFTVSNVYGVAPEPGYFQGGGITKYFCLIDYDQHAVFGIPVVGDKFYPTQARVYEYTPKTGDKGYGQDILTDGEYTYALFVSAKEAWTGDYSYYSLVRLNGDLKEDATLQVNTYNPFSLQKYKNNLYVTSVGGMQKKGSTNGAASKIERIPLDFNDSTPVEPALVGGDDATTGDFRALAFSSNSNDAYVLTGNIVAADGALDGALHYLTMDDLEGADSDIVSDVETGKPAVFNNVPGYNWGLVYSEEDKAVWFRNGNNLSVYKFDNTAKTPKELATIAIDALAGEPNYNLNGFALVGEGKNFKGYVSPTFASVSKRALEEREKLLK